MSPAPFKDQTGTGRHELRPGLKIVATDNTTRMSFPSYLKGSGDELLKMDDHGKEIHHYIRKK